MNNNTEIKIKDFRAIHKADILLNGITVIAGVNGSGKSTISRVLYHAFDSANNMDSIFFSNFKDEMRPIAEIYEQLVDSYPDLGAKRAFYITRYDMDHKRALLEKAARHFQTDWQNNPESPIVNRLGQIISYNIKTEVTSDNVVTKLLDVFDDKVNTYHNLKENRPISSLDAILSTFFDERTLLNNIKILEYGVPFFGHDIVKVPFFHNIKNTTYIESPLTINFSKFWFGVVEGTNSSLYRKLIDEKNYNDETSSIVKYIGSSVIGGNVFLHKDSDEIVYQRNDGEIFPLQDCATGIKSFAMLSLLAKNGHINDRSLIIIDEPEAHLHPQWIVEYAKVIVELNKQVGAKFFIASHSTDLVSAIRYIADKEERLNILAFYNAVPAQGSDFMFDYESLGTDIEPIFESFNKSFNLIEQYGADSSEV